ncbi:MAG: tetratricopeptide repeat protein [Candidatus Methylumidiphilus sp.]
MNPLDQAVALYVGGQHQAALNLALGEAKPLLNILAASAQALGRHAEAEHYWLLVLLLQPANHHAHNNLGLLLAQQGQHAEAEARYRQALAICPDYAEGYNNLGNALADLNRPAEAEAAYRQALALKPDYAEAHNNLAELLRLAGRHAEAEASFRRGLALNANDAGALYNFGNVLADTGQHAEAEAAYRRAILLRPDYAEAYSNLGILLKAARRHAEAEDACRQVLALRPDFAGGFNNLGEVLRECGRYAEAEAAYRQALALQPDYAGAYGNLGLALAAAGRPAEAESAYRQALALRPGYALALNNLGVLLASLHRHAEAESAYRQALALRPDYVSALNNLGVLFESTQRLVEAEATYRQALALQPNAAETLNNLAAMCLSRRRFAEAEAAFKLALAAQPAYADARFNLATLLLSLGRWREAWPLYEARHYPEKTLGAVRKPSLPLAEWQGEDLTGKRLLLWPEQGFGDEIQFCRLVPALKQRGAAHVGLVCKPALAPLLQTLAGVDAVYPLADRLTVDGPYDYWALLLSVPGRLDLSLENLPATLPYLYALPERLAHWQAALPTSGLRIGLVWQGRSSYAHDALRSLPGLAVLAPLWTVPGLAFVSLQKGAGEDEARQPPPGLDILDLGSALADFADTAAVIAQLDLLICVDTAVAHLAGALGKPCWVLLPYLKTDWRWLHGRADSPWYPGVMRLFRQGAAESWGDVVVRVAAALAQT